MLAYIQTCTSSGHGNILLLRVLTVTVYSAMNQNAVVGVSGNTSKRFTDQAAAVAFFNEVKSMGIVSVARN